MDEELKKRFEEKYFNPKLEQHRQQTAKKNTNEIINEHNNNELINEKNNNEKTNLQTPNNKIVLNEAVSERNIPAGELIKKQEKNINFNLNEEKKKLLIYGGIGTFLVMLAWIPFGLTEISAKLLFSFFYEPLLFKLFSTEFLFFVLFFTLAPAFFVIKLLSIDKKQALIVGVGSSLMGLLLSSIIAPVLWDYWILFIFYLAGIAVLIYSSFIRITELKKFVYARTLNYSIKNFMIFILLGIMLLGAITISSNKEIYDNSFDDLIFEPIESSSIAQQAQLLGINIRTAVKQQLPMLDEIKPYLTIMHPLMIMSSFWFFSGIFLRPLGILYGIIIEKILERFE